MPSQAATKLGNVMIMQNSRAGTHLLHVLKRLSMLMLLGNSIKHPTDECIDGIIIFVLNLYCKNRPTDISNLSKLQWHMFSKKQLESGKSPPTFSALKYTIH